eukprot:EG_transcript_2545
MCHRLPALLCGQAAGRMWAHQRPLSTAAPALQPTAPEDRMEDATHPLQFDDNADRYVLELEQEKSMRKRLADVLDGKLKNLMDIKDVAGKMGARKLMDSMLLPLRKAIELDQRAISSSEGMWVLSYQSLSSSVLALIVLQELVALAMVQARNDHSEEGQSFSVGTAQQHVAQEVELEISMQRVMAGQGAKRLPLKQLRQRARKTMHRGEMFGGKIAERLLQLLRSNPQLLLVSVEGEAGQPPSVQPALTFDQRNITVNSVVFDYVNQDLAKGMINFLVKSKVPIMVSRPRPWAGCSSPYYDVQADIMRTKGSHIQRDLLAVANTSHWCAALDALSQTKWKINEPVLEVMDRLWQAGHPLGKMPRREADPLADTDDLPAHASFRELAQLKVSQVEGKKRNAEQHALRADYLLKINNAKHLRHVPELFIPHNADFRGRAYPMHPHLQHMGSDIPRGLLRFADGKPLGERGLRWLFIHCANTYGKDKLSFEDRVAFVQEHLTDICRCGASVDAACEAGAWWQTADKPFQCLATCREIAQAMQLGDPRQYRCSLPIHADGSCNGLQHFVALSRDELGAQHVNMHRSDGTMKPDDAYSGVLRVVLEQLKRDAQLGKPMALQLEGHVKRSTIKQTVMTTVYGVTAYGAKHQVARQLRAQGLDLSHQEVDRCAKYLAGLTLESLGVVFSRARELQDWLKVVAKTVVTDTRQPISWTTPLGIPVVQPYVSRDAFLVSRRTTGERVGLSQENELNQANAVKQATAFPPNLVHSIDSSHMYLTALQCAKQGIAFAGVHDSFWTHPCDMDTLRVLTRQQFVALHGQPLLEQLRQALQLQYDVDLDPVPAPGRLDIAEVLDSEYFFS